MSAFGTTQRTQNGTEASPRDRHPSHLSRHKPRLLPSRMVSRLQSDPLPRMAKTRAGAGARGLHMGRHRLHVERCAPCLWPEARGPRPQLQRQLRSKHKLALDSMTPSRPPLGRPKAWTTPASLRRPDKDLPSSLVQQREPAAPPGAPPGARGCASSHTHSHAVSASQMWVTPAAVAQGSHVLSNRGASPATTGQERGAREDQASSVERLYPCFQSSLLWSEAAHTLIHAPSRRSHKRGEETRPTLSGESYPKFQATVPWPVVLKG